MILEILGSSGLGAIIGSVGGWLTKREERKSLKLKMDHDINMIKAKTDASTKIAQLDMQQAEVAGKLAVEKVEAKAFEESQKKGGSWGEAIKSLVRPVILGLLMYQTYLIMDSLEKFTGGLVALPAAEVLSLYKIVVLSITGLTATAVGWYFAARSSKQFDKLVDKWQ